MGNGINAYSKNEIHLYILPYSKTIFSLIGSWFNIETLKHKLTTVRTRKKKNAYILFPNILISAFET